MPVSDDKSPPSPKVLDYGTPSPPADNSSRKTVAQVLAWFGIIPFALMILGFAPWCVKWAHEAITNADGERDLALINGPTCLAVVATCLYACIRLGRVASGRPPVPRKQVGRRGRFVVGVVVLSLATLLFLCAAALGIYVAIRWSRQLAIDSLYSAHTDSLEIATYAAWIWTFLLLLAAMGAAIKLVRTLRSPTQKNPGS